MAWNRGPLSGGHGSGRVEDMTVPPAPVGVVEIIARIRGEADRRRAIEMAEGRGMDAAEPFPAKRKYPLAEFLRLDGVDFVRACYIGLLRRDPGPAELAAEVEQLHSGRFEKADLLIRLRWSAEGRQLDVKVSGLERLRRIHHLRRVPLLGPVAASIIEWLWPTTRGAGGPRREA
jgi:hypothetical protein